MKNVTYGEGQLQQLQNETVENRAMPISPKPTYTKKTVRLPDELWGRAEAQADLNGRSLNAEITARLLEAYAQPTLADLERKHDETQQLVRQALQEIEALSIRK